MLDLPFFWLGTLGKLTPMACPADSVNSTLTVTGDVKSSLRGRNVRDVLAYRRAWDMSEAWLDARDHSLLESYLANSHETTYRLIDPLIRNRARLFASMTSNFSGYAQAEASWHPETGAVTFVTGDVPFVPPVPSEGDARPVGQFSPRKALWAPGTGPGGAGGRLSVNGQPTGPGLGTVMLEDVDASTPGETLTFSAWVKLGGGANVALRLTSVTVDPSLLQPAGTGSLSADFSSSAVQTGTSWTRVSTTFTVPNITEHIGVFPQFTSTSLSGTISIYGVQIERGSTPTSFVRGGGGAEVLLTNVSSISPRYPLINADLSLLEV